MNNLKEVKLFLIDDKLYMGSNDDFKASDLCIIPAIDKKGWDKKTYLVDSLTSNYMVLSIEEMSYVRKVMATPEQIGWTYGMGTTNQMDALYQISSDDISRIFEKGGKCWIEYFPNEEKPRIIHDKVIIHLNANVIVDDTEEKKEIIQNRSCPCLYLNEPCQPHCTCVSPLMSHGCLNCATYGSVEQRKKMAEYLNESRLFYKKNKPETELDKMQNILEHVKLATKMAEIRDLKNTIVRAQDYEGAAKLREEERAVLDQIELLKPIDKETFDRFIKIDQ